jgi:hypothetical protein
VAAEGLEWEYCCETIELDSCARTANGRIIRTSGKILRGIFTGMAGNFETASLNGTNQNLEASLRWKLVTPNTLNLLTHQWMAGWPAP